MHVTKKKRENCILGMHLTKLKMYWTDMNQLMNVCGTLMHKLLNNINHNKDLLKFIL